ncbi:hypothetical protein AALA99_00600 [Anaerotruncus colihominis]|uniref:hypothetical protein n=1 Tax=Anaerotruncus colihominis TaxID=169435 RepID=UPI001362B0F2|nr:hypothetical protein [Anaerotruncus colihominis]
MKQRVAHAAPLLKPALPVSLPLWYNMRSANGFAVCSRHLAATAAKQRAAHVTPQPKPALLV